MTYYGVPCVTCGQDCLPLPPLDICGFCDREPATGEFPAAMPKEERQRALWRESQRRSRANKKEVAA